MEAFNVKGNFCQVFQCEGNLFEFISTGFDKVFFETGCSNACYHWWGLHQHCWIESKRAVYGKM
jgi:hypothetical protein